MSLLRTVTPDELPERSSAALVPEALAVVRAIVDDVRQRGEAAVREHAERLGDLAPGAPLVVSRAELTRALEALPGREQALLRRVSGRIEAFARAQREALGELRVPLPGGAAGHTWAPVETAGCYAPGGRFPLPSSVLMTAVTARAAGVEQVVVASPRPTQVTLAAAAVAGADQLLAVGGAQAIAALAHGAGVPACDVIVGPGNRYVTAAKQLVSGQVRIDMLAGPSELVVLADADADAATVAADLLAQAEHDVDALPVLITDSADLIERVRAEVERQLATLPTADSARVACERGFAVLARDLRQAVACADRLAPEHLQVLTREPVEPRHYGALFRGAAACEVLGDYGAGPNHVLPTGGSARSVGGLSVATFLRLRTWLELDAPDPQVVADAVALARLEGLEAHARAAERRL